MADLTIDTQPASSTAASTRPSAASPDPSSARSSLSLDRSTALPARRNRTALRNYYNLAASTSTTTSITANPNPAASTTSLIPLEDREEEEGESELDAADFDAQAYITAVLANEDLEGVLRVEARLLNGIRGLDGERKALVYDNYSKLIAATDTIRRMRMDMGPLAPIMAGLAPAITQIADTAASISRNLRGKLMFDMEGVGREEEQEEEQEQEEKDGAERAEDVGAGAGAGAVATVSWVLSSPERLRALMRQGQAEEAKADWAEVEALLGKWEGVAGVDEIRRMGSEIMQVG